MNDVSSRLVQDINSQFMMKFRCSKSDELLGLLVQLSCQEPVICVFCQIYSLLVFLFPFIPFSYILFFLYSLLPYSHFSVFPFPIFSFPHIPICCFPFSLTYFSYIPISQFSLFLFLFPCICFLSIPFPLFLHSRFLIALPLFYFP